jgi:hypothetical protein
MPKLSSETEDLRIRKKKLETELQVIQSQLEDTIEDIRDDVSEKINPLYWIKKFPLRAVGVAVAVGFLLAKIGKPGGNNSSPDREKFSSLFASELKKIGAQKAASYGVNALEKRFYKEK